MCVLSHMCLDRNVTKVLYVHLDNIKFVFQLTLEISVIDHTNTRKAYIVTLTVFACHYLPLTNPHIHLKFSPVTLQQSCNLPHTFSGLRFAISK